MCERCEQEQTPTVWGNRPDFEQKGYKLLDQTNPDNLAEMVEWLQKVAYEPIYEV